MGILTTAGSLLSVGTSMDAQKEAIEVANESVESVWRGREWS